MKRKNMMTPYPGWWGWMPIQDSCHVNIYPPSRVALAINTYFYQLKIFNLDSIPDPDSLLVFNTYIIVK